MAERRRGQDRLIVLLHWLAIVCWACVMVLLTLYHYARPEIAYGFLRYGGIAVREHWDPALTPWLEYSLWGCVAFTLLVLTLQYRRSRREQDGYQLSLRVLLLILIISLLLFYFG
ncbi:hypothetical protein ACW5WQ_14035 [Aeromonas rivuli]|uniref:hypothetical protein n=1 Tax=Aeromonas rivuli TaxID=648794 RepID=UPI0005A883C8|nr:hypothetical protein [Aeromonas rivuli]UBO75322.1 hypothetical protein KYK33_07300 [Aeromonas rivuli]